MLAHSLTDLLRYYFGSTGWLDGDWAWSTLYDKLAACGKPLGLAVGAPAPLVYMREYEHCRVAINCTDQSKDGCKSTIDWPPVYIEDAAGREPV